MEIGNREPEIRKFDQFEEELWGHSIATGIAAQHIAGLCKKVDPSEAFVGGLLHDVGKIVLNNTASQRFRTATANAIKNDTPYYVAEHEEFKFQHGSVGAVLMEVWGLSQALIDTSLYHHHTDQWDRIEDDSKALLSIVVLADQLINHCAINAGTREFELGFTPDCLQWLNLEPETVEALKPTIIAVYETDKSIYFG